jgi:uncharacterized protein (DUF1697 family)
MQYVALLRGINVGGTNKVDMKQLKAVFESVGMREVKTYINSGNVLFEHGAEKDEALVRTLENAIEKEFGFHVNVLVKSKAELQAVVEAMPTDWHNGGVMKCDVVFLWDGMTVNQALAELKAREGIDEVRTVPGVIIWKVDRKNVGKSGLLRMMGTPLYKKVTIRNSNTTRKLLDILLQRGVQ